MKYSCTALTTLRIFRSLTNRIGVATFLRILPLVFACVLVYSHAARAQTPKEKINVTNDVPYGTADGHPLLLDIYQPLDSPLHLHPAVVLIHGGSWTTGGKSNMRDLAHSLAQSGFVAFSIDYRLLRKHHWPDQLDDAQRSVRWIRANAAKYGVDPNHVGAFGHSAGAQMAALLGMVDTRDNSDAALAQYSSKVGCVSEAAGPIDFTRFQGDGLLRRLLGGSFEERPDVWRDASPIFHVAKDNAPFLVIHGTSDHKVAISQSEELVDALQKAGVPVTFLKLDDGHLFKKSESRRQISEASLALFRKYLPSTN